LSVLRRCISNGCGRSPGSGNNASGYRAAPSAGIIALFAAKAASTIYAIFMSGGNWMPAA
jgi:hypothetical protein